MKNTRQVAVIVAVMLVLAGLVVAWVSRPLSTAPSDSTVVPQARSIAPTPSRSPVAQADPARPDPAQADPNSPDGEETPEFVTEPVTEPSADEQAVRPSAETINAVREIRKPAEGEGQVTEYPDGSASVNLGNRYQSVPVATVGKDGKVNVEYHGEKYLQPEVQQPEVKKTETHQP